MDGTTKSMRHPVVPPLIGHGERKKLVLMGSVCWLQKTDHPRQSNWNLAHQEPGLEQIDGLILLVHGQLALVVERPRQLRRAHVQPQRRSPAVEAAAVLTARSPHTCSLQHSDAA